MDPAEIRQGDDARLIVMAGTSTLELDDALGLWRWDEEAARWVSALPAGGASTLVLTTVESGGRLELALHTAHLPPGRYRVEKYPKVRDPLRAEFTIAASSPSS